MVIKIPLYVAFSVGVRIISKSLEQESSLFSNYEVIDSEKRRDFNEENPNYLLNMISLPYPALNQK